MIFSGAFQDNKVIICIFRYITIYQIYLIIAYFFFLKLCGDRFLEPSVLNNLKKMKRMEFISFVILRGPWSPCIGFSVKVRKLLKFYGRTAENQENSKVMQLKGNIRWELSVM